MIRVQVVDPSAYTPPYDHSLCAALSREGAQVELLTSAFAYGPAPSPQGYRVSHLFYRHARGGPGSPARRALKLLEHGPDMLRLRRRAEEADLVHFQWLPVQWLDRHLLPRRPVVLTAHDLLPREPRPLQAGAQRRLYDAVSAVVVHSAYGRDQLVGSVGVPEAKVRVIHHGAFDYLADLPPGPLPPELPDTEAAVVMFFGLLRPYKGLELLLSTWRELDEPEAELWIVGRPRMPVEALRGLASANVRFVTRFVSEAEAAACFRRADVVVLPYSHTERFDFSGVLASALAFAKPAVISDIGGFSEVADTGAAQLFPPGDGPALAGALRALLADPAARTRMAAAARAAAQGPYSWDSAARQTVSLYQELMA